MSGRNTAWRNWAGSARCVPQELVVVRDEEDIVRAVQRAAAAGHTVRTAGTGHSFNPIVTTDGVLLDLTGYSGIVSVDRHTPAVTVRAGTSLRRLNLELEKVGLALSNMGTLDEQTIGGALSTGNHGSGITHPPFTGQLLGLRLVTADGTIRECAADSDPELFLAAGTALGALGVLSTVTLRCVPRFKLRVVSGSEPLAAILADAPAWASRSDHATFSLKAWSGPNASTLKLDRTDDPVSADATRRRYGNTLGEVRCTLAGLAGRVDQRAVRGLMTARLPFAVDRPPHYVDRSFDAFTFPQPVKFLSLEYALPVTELAEAVPAVQRDVTRFGRQTPYSVTVRFAAADDFLLSLAHGRTTGFVNITVPRTVGYTELLRTFEAVLREHQGRPHWGKAHTATWDVIADRYPGWQRFQAVRAELDPRGMFTSDYLRRVLGG
ncbi:D-arabinono-1,4-lactone oxidase [Actinokineospora enzanensis]|uniref:D-arabinono-1,4-lactone oxidase n=1 Tax=Actinokineospora enzanensis TaxID=155975 RepID=UPI00037F4E6A|nr:D-arabinono-1,4-lactone oxidase [Actinokineospora enzanensis]